MAANDHRKVQAKGKRLDCQTLRSQEFECGHHLRLPIPTDQRDLQLLPQNLRASRNRGTREEVYDYCA